MPAPPSQAPRLVADVGGTNTRIALFDPAAAEFRSLATYTNREFERLEDIIARWLDSRNEPVPDNCCIAVAAPPSADRVVMSRICSCIVFLLRSEPRPAASRSHVRRRPTSGAGRGFGRPTRGRPSFRETTMVSHEPVADEHAHRATPHHRDPKAPPMMIPTAMSTTLPRMANFLNSCNMNMSSVD